MKNIFRNRGKNKGSPTFFILFGSGLVILGIFGFFIGAGLGFIRFIFQIHGGMKFFIEQIIWYSAMPLVFGFILIFVEFILLVRKKRLYKKLENRHQKSNAITVLLTAYNDEKSIGAAVKDFKNHPLVKRVVVVSNNSNDNTIKVAKAAGAIVYNEDKQGYGSCVFRCILESLRFKDTNLICLAEGDCTFRAYDLDKFLPYTYHAEVVSGTRIVEQLQENRNQLSMFMHYGNYFVAKLLEFKYTGEATLSDVGSTYKVIRRKTLLKLASKLDSDINHEFNAHFLEAIMKNGHSLLECPITFHPRVGKSKGANQSNLKSAIVGLRMIIGIFFGWKIIK
jgi:glycosyltransferase involved in cell wall biosynthesis